MQCEKPNARGYAGIVALSTYFMLCLRASSAILPSPVAEMRSIDPASSAARPDLVGPVKNYDTSRSNRRLLIHFDPHPKHDKKKFTWPEFLFGGTWNANKAKATILEFEVLPPECHATTLLHLDPATVLVAWFAGRKEGSPDVTIWTGIRKLYEVNVDPPPNQGLDLTNRPNARWRVARTIKVSNVAHWNPVLFCEEEQEGVAEDGSIMFNCASVLLFFKVGKDIPVWRTLVTRSRDHGETWEAPWELVPGSTGDGGRGPVKNKPIVLSDGTWLAGGSIAPRKKGAEQGMGFIDLSTDRGATWKHSEYLRPTSWDVRQHLGINQPTLWESAPGHVHAFLRTKNKGPDACIWRTDSADGGRTWSQPRRTKLPNNNSGIDAVRLPASGTLVLAHNPVTYEQGRAPLRLSLSDDNGETWPRALDVESELVAGLKTKWHEKRHEFAYPAIIAWPGPRDAGNEGISLSYTWHRMRIAYFSISMAELRARAGPPKNIPVLPPPTKAPPQGVKKSAKPRPPASLPRRTSVAPDEGVLPTYGLLGEAM
eukprot:jgi/Mesvir1/13572/Mv02991-RA.1